MSTELDAIPLTGPPAVAVPRIEAVQLVQFAAVLRRAGYGAAQELQNGNVPAPMESSEGHLATLRRLFWRGEAVPELEAAEALVPVSLSDLVQRGLLRQNANGVRAVFQIQVYGGLFFIVDYLPQVQPPDVVLPIGPSGKYLASVTIRKPVESALDLGCGCGIQALLLARHAQHVTATDINPRALELTRLNATMNVLPNIETLEGSYFEPVAGRRFDLLVANLPYVITPESKYIYRDVGRPDDLPIRRNVGQIPLRLNEGGFAHVMLNRIHAADQAWWEPLEDWTKRRNVDGWLLYSHSQSPEQYTRQWLWID
jgi:methylase of polypeptide subunit release factors